MGEQARVAIIGGGAVGCSCLYHLARAGWTDCLLLEQDELTAGSTWHAAGNCPTFSGSWNIIKYQHYSTKLYKGWSRRSTIRSTTMSPAPSALRTPKSVRTSSSMS